MPQTARKTINDRITHYRLVNALARQENRCTPAAVGALHQSNRISLAAIATAMDVPVVLATFRDENDVQTFATHGLGLMNNLARFAAVCDRLCSERVMVITDTRLEPALATLARHWPDESIRFLVGIPLRNVDGKRVGSLAVMNSTQAVARKGISFRMLADIGTAFSQTGQLR